MTDSADIKIAAEKMDEALARLEQALSPLSADLARLKDEVSESVDMQKDRAQLAQQLDEALAREAALKKKQQNIVLMADDTLSELDGVITQVKQALTS